MTRTVARLLQKLGARRIRALRIMRDPFENDPDRAFAGGEAAGLDLAMTEIRAAFPDKLRPKRKK